MDLRLLPPEARRTAIEQELGVDLRAVKINPETLGDANEKNCEQMFGHVPIPVGIAGPLSVQGQEVYLPLATTEGALVASVNRGCKAIGDVKVKSIYHGISRSIALRAQSSELKAFIQENEQEWKRIGESTSNHLKILKFDIDESGDYLFLTLYADTDEAMGMNMITIAAQAIGNWLVEEKKAELITIAGNVDSDKKPSKRTHDTGRGYEIVAETIVSAEVIESVLKTTPDQLLKVADAKLNHGSQVAGALGTNLHAANVVAALYLATGQDAAHVVEGSLADTSVSIRNSKFEIQTRCPSIIVGTIGGGTSLPAQKQCLGLLGSPNRQRLAKIIGATVLAGELSLLAAQATHTLASSHKKLARK